MATLNAPTKRMIKRLAAINYDEPYWNPDKVIEHMKRHYELLGVPMPKIEIADNTVGGFQIARGAAWDAARDAARDAVDGISFLNTLPKDKQVIKYIEIQTEVLKALENGLGYYFPMKDKLVLVPMPRMILLNDRLHYDHGKAVEWGDNTGFYFLRGVKFEEELYWKVINHELSAEEILQIRNSDERMAAISMLKPDVLLKQMNARLIHVGIKGTKLYEVKNFMDTGETEYCMWMKDASTDRQFFQFVEWRGTNKSGYDVKTDADHATAWMFRNIKGTPLPVEDYLNLLYEA